MASFVLPSGKEIPDPGFEFAFASDEALAAAERILASQESSKDSRLIAQSLISQTKSVRQQEIVVKDFLRAFRQEIPREP